MRSPEGRSHRSNCDDVRFISMLTKLKVTIYRKQSGTLKWRLCRRNDLKSIVSLIFWLSTHEKFRTCHTQCRNVECQQACCILSMMCVSRILPQLEIWLSVTRSTSYCPPSLPKGCKSVTRHLACAYTNLKYLKCAFSHVPCNASK